MILARVRMIKGSSRRTSKYTDWFVSDLWSKIESVLTLQSFKFKATVRYLQRRYVMPGSKSIFYGMNESTLRGWFESDGQTLRPRIEATMLAIKNDNSAKAIMHPRQKGVWEGHNEVEAEFIEWMQQLRDTNMGLDFLLIAFQMKAFILACAPQMTIEYGGYFRVSRSYVRRWARDWLGWSFCKPISNASKLPQDWEKKRDLLTLRLAILVHNWVIPPSLVVNVDQTAIHLLLVGNEHTYACRGSRDVSVAGRENK